MAFLAVSTQAQDPATTPSAPDYGDMLTKALDEGFEGFQKAEPATLEEFRDYLHLLGQIVEMKTFKEKQAKRTQILVSQTAEVEAGIANFKPPVINADSGLDAFDSARLDLWQALNWLAALKKIGESRTEQNRISFEELKKAQSDLQALQNAGNPSTPQLAWQRKLQDLRVAVAYAEHQARTDSSSHQADMKLQEARIKMANKYLGHLKGHVVFPTGLLNAKREQAQKDEGESAQTAQDLENQVKALPSSGTFRRYPELSSLLMQGLENQIQISEYRRIGLLIRSQIWQARHDIWNTTDPKSFEKTARAVNDRMQDVQTWHPLIANLNAKTQERRRAAQALLEDPNQKAPDAIRQLVEKYFTQEDAALSKWETGFDHLVQLLTLANADLTERRGQLNMGQKLNVAAATLGGEIGTLWNTEIFHLNDSVFINGEVIQRPSPVTLGMMLSALLILIIGGLLSAASSRWIRSHLSARFSLDANTGTIIQKFSNALLLVCIILIALAVVKIPLTIFALLGGAAAIAVGFGSQQLVNNLISGIILLFERPIRIGDIIDVGTYAGTVTSIGTRCSQLRRADGVEILIPNSVILQGTVVNWTLTDSHVRQEILVGINYGSPVEKALEIIAQVAKSHPDVLKNGDANVFFHDFGADAIVLRLLYWVDKQVIGSAHRVPSELRLSIYNALSAAGIGLAFPQRDIHLATAAPISVQVLPPAAQ
jgi:small-conductance mechanosensitive channel